MANKKEIYKCSVCGNIIELLISGGGTLVCCGKPMELLNEKTNDPVAAKEKHLPIIEKRGNKILVKVSSIEHPMEKEHYIQFIELIVNDEVYRKDLKPKMKPKAEFCIKTTAKDKIHARELCNLHGLWKSI